MQKQKKTTLTESQVKLKKYLKPIVEGIMNEESYTPPNNSMSKTEIQKIQKHMAEIEKILYSYTRGAVRKQGIELLSALNELIKTK
jgi:hypothetical protein